MSARLPVVGSTAATTAFCSDRLDGPNGTHLFLDGNGKITAGNGTLAAPKPNALSLLQISDCPGSTPACQRACYVHNLATAQPDLHALYAHNSAELRRILADRELADAWVIVLADWIRQNAYEGFRWHVSGDVFSNEYAEFIADVCRESPDVAHWIYTRSYQFLAPLAEVCTLRGGNLALNLSCDRDNYAIMRSVADVYGIDWGDGTRERLRLCYLSVDGKVPDDLLPDDVIFPDYALRPRQFKTLAESPWWQTLEPEQRGLVCPVDAHGKAENRRCGPCNRCMT